MNKLVLIITALLLAADVCGQQNLVPNSSFEDVSGCPLQSYITDAPPWEGTGGGTSPDLFNECFPPLIVTTDTLLVNGVPENKAGTQPAHSGDGYAGIYVGNDTVLSFPDNVREYLQVQLLQPLRSRIRYEVSFYVSLADKFWYGLGTLGAYFSEERVERNDYFVFDVEPSIESPPDIVYTDKENWVEVRDTFVSRTGGGEQWLLIGNFRTDTESQLTFVDSGAGINYYKSYYYIDDVSVVALDSVPSGISPPAPQRGVLEVWPNPARDVLRFKVRGSAWQQGSLGVRVVDAVGREILRQGSPPGKEGSGEVDISPLPKGIYFLELTDGEGKRAMRRFVKQ
ncbi:MAG: T9SS type A sorting domain-containing protein [Flavobacteriales bacterium]|nr:T9SS type A sorting domain-containing protein [Flavobacteriales bacterium]